MRGAVFGAVALTSLLGPHARAEPVAKASCARAHERAQVERQAGHLLASREALAFCAQRTCPVLAKSDCSGWLVEVDAAIPTIVVEARADGKLADDVLIVLDGVVVLTRGGDGTALSLDPGVHTLRFEHHGSRSVEREIRVVVGEKNRRVSVDLEREAELAPAGAPSAAPPRASTGDQGPSVDVTPPRPPARRAPPVIAYSFAAVAAAGVGAFAYAGSKGVAEENRLRDRCAPSCDRGDVQGVVTAYLVADIALTAALVAAGISAWLFLSR